MTDAEMSEDEAQRETARTLADIMILLEFVGRQADSRLQAQFEDTRAGLSGLVPRLAVPPCPTYTRFLERLISIGSGPKRVCKTTGLQTAGRGALSTPSATAQLTSPPTDAGRSSDRPSSSDKPLSDRAFLYFSRDFLAAVAAPATVASIKFTAEYRKARGRSWLRCGRRWPRASRAPATPRAAPSLDNPAQPAEGASEERGSPLHDGAARLACQVASTKFLALLLTIFTLLVSTYAFSGHTILDSQHQTIVEYRAISALEEGYGNTNLDPPSWCDPANHYLRKDELETRSASMAADQGPALSNATKCGLYWRLKSATENITAVNLHLMSWTRTVSMLQRPLPELFGMSPSFLDG